MEGKQIAAVVAVAPRRTQTSAAQLCHQYLPSYVTGMFGVLIVFPLPKQEYVQFFKHKLERKVSWGDRMEFINGWYILLVISDVFTIVGSFIKIGIESKVGSARRQEHSGFLCGLGTCGVWKNMIFLLLLPSLFLTTSSFLPFFISCSLSF